MSDCIYFRNVRIKEKKEYFWHLISRENGELTYIHTSGILGVVDSFGNEKILNGLLNDDGDLYVTINDIDYKIKYLVANEMINDFDTTKYMVLFADGNKENCNCYNLRIYDKNISKFIGIYARKNHNVWIKGKRYYSIPRVIQNLYIDVNNCVIYKNIKK